MCLWPVGIGLGFVFSQLDEVVSVIAAIDATRLMVGDHAMLGHVGDLTEEDVDAISLEGVLGEVLVGKIAEVEADEAESTRDPQCSMPCRHG